MTEDGQITAAEFPAPLPTQGSTYTCVAPGRKNTITKPDTDPGLDATSEKCWPLSPWSQGGSAWQLPGHASLGSLARPNYTDRQLPGDVKFET